MKSILLVAVIACLSVFGQDGQTFTQQQTIDYAMQHCMQSGNFFFLPFPLDNGLHITEYSQRKGMLPSQMDTILKLLATFEKIKKVEVDGQPQLIRDQNAHTTSSQTFGILLRIRTPKK